MEQEAAVDPTAAADPTAAVESTLTAAPRPRLATPAFLTVVFAAMAYFIAIGVLAPSAGEKA